MWRACLREVAAFGIAFTIAERGAARMRFGEGLVQPDPMPVYEASVVGDVRRAVMSGNLKDFGAIGDPDKMAQAMIDSASRYPAPRRLAMGSSTYAHIRNELTARLAELDAQKEVAQSTDEAE